MEARKKKEQNRKNIARKSIFPCQIKPGAHKQGVIEVIDLTAEVIELSDDDEGMESNVIDLTLDD